MAASPEIEVRAGRREDLEAIGDVQAHSAGASQWKPAEYLEHDLRVAVVEGVLAGFVVARRVAEGESEILNLAVAPGYRRRGVARALVAAVLGAHPGEVFLEVRESSRGARAFYESMGFTELFHRPGYYTDPPEGAVVMKFRSCYCQGR